MSIAHYSRLVGEDMKMMVMKMMREEMEWRTRG